MSGFIKLLKYGADRHRRSSPLVVMLHHRQLSAAAVEDRGPQGKRRGNPRRRHPRNGEEIRRAGRRRSRSSRARARRPRSPMPIMRRRARRSAIAPRCSKDADIILCVTGPDPASLEGRQAGRAAGRRARSGAARRRHRRLCRGRARSAGDGVDAAHHARPVDGHPVVAVEPRRLQGGGRRRVGLWPRLSDDDDRGGHGQPGQGCSSWASASPDCRRSPPARRLGAQVSATDVRSATREQILSLGAKPIFVENVAGIEGEGQGGYAGETSPEYQAAQAELVSSHIAKQDIVITTALIPGRPAPRLISDAQLATMRPGSVIVDLAAEAGGNVEGCVAGETRRAPRRDDHRRGAAGAHAWRPTPRRCSRATWTISSPPSGTRKTAAPVAARRRRDRRRRSA